MFDVGSGNLRTMKLEVGVNPMITSGRVSEYAVLMLAEFHLLHLVLDLDDEYKTTSICNQRTCLAKKDLLHDRPALFSFKISCCG